MARYILPALALAGTALAQCDGEITIRTQEDASTLASCSTYEGDIIIDSEASGQISLAGVGIIEGTLRATNASQLTAISGNDLQTITEVFDLQELQIMSSLQFPQLRQIGQVNWIALPALQSLNFQTGIQEANTVYISNTGLTTLAGIELTAVGAMDVNNNQYLRTINVNNLGNVTQSLAFSANGLNLEIEFPNLENAGNLTFRNVTSVSMPSLATVENNMGFYSNYFESFAAPNLTETGGTIAFIDSSALSNLSFPSLERIGGGLYLANNSALTDIDGFNSLTTIDGDINFYGAFEEVAFPGPLEDVKGAAIVYTSSNATQICDLFNDAQRAQVVKGEVDCVTESDDALTGNGTGSGSGGNRNNENGAVRSQLSMAVTGFVVFAAALLFI